MRELMGLFSKYLEGKEGKFNELARLGTAFGRFDPSEFPLDGDMAADGDGPPGSGGSTRGRGGAPRTGGGESLPRDRRSRPTPGFARCSACSWPRVSAA